ncbi:MAG: hypothetical protein E6Q68_02650 [Polynucleobacter sp.]|nr:MAG: hypothetical protein E6Q68_02650 [Polynucleobacter sp.]
MGNIKDLLKSIAQNIKQSRNFGPLWDAIFGERFQDCDAPFGYDPKTGAFKVKPIDGSPKKYAWVENNQWHFGTKAELDAAILAQQ